MSVAFGQAVFLIFFGGAALWFGVVVFRTHSMVRSAIALLFSQTAVGGMFLVMQAEFLGVLQIMMMASEMSVMAIFMVMFMMDPGGMGEMDMSHQKKLSLIAGGTGFAAALAVVTLGGWGPGVAIGPDANAQLQGLGRELLGRSMLIFESAGLTILTAMIAATMVAIAPPASNGTAPASHAHTSDGGSDGRTDGRTDGGPGDGSTGASGRRHGGHGGHSGHGGHGGHGGHDHQQHHHHHHGQQNGTEDRP